MRYLDILTVHYCSYAEVTFHNLTTSHNVSRCSTGSAGIAAWLCGHVPVSVDFSASRCEVADRRLSLAKEYMGWGVYKDATKVSELLLRSTN
jgi:hypothetical protein